jgi:hypothetical protein
MERDNFSCQNCLANDKTLNVHHKIYHKGRKPWEYEDRELVTLCEECHEKETHQRKRLNEALAILPPLDVSYVLGYATSLVMLQLAEDGGPDVLKGTFFTRSPAELRGLADGLSIDVMDPEFSRLRDGLTLLEFVELHLEARRRRAALYGNAKEPDEGA